MIHIKLFEEFKKSNSLIYMSFDIDDNLLHTKTTIIMEHLVDGEWIDEEVDTEKFAQIRTDKDWRFKPGEESFINFRDWGPHGDDTFLIAFKYAVENKLFAPSWVKFIECLVNGLEFKTLKKHIKNLENRVRKVEEFENRIKRLEVSVSTIEFIEIQLENFSRIISDIEKNLKRNY